MAIDENPTDPSSQGYGGEYTDPLTGKLIPRGGYGGGGGPIAGQSWEDYWKSRGAGPGDNWTDIFKNLVPPDPLGNIITGEGLTPGSGLPGGGTTGSGYYGTIAGSVDKALGLERMVNKGGEITPEFLAAMKGGGLLNLPPGGGAPPAGPDLSFLGQGGGGPDTAFYQWLADQRAREGNPELQRTSIDWSGYGSGQGPAPTQPTPTPYSAYPGASGGGSPPPPQPAGAGTTPPAGSTGTMRTLAGGIPQSAMEPNAPAAAGGGAGFGGFGGGVAGATPTGQPPPPTGGGVRPKALTAPEQPQPPGNPANYAAGSLRPVGTAGGAGQVSVQQQPLNTAANRGATSQTFAPPGPKYPAVPAVPTGQIAPVGQYANPVFQQQQQTRNEQTGLLSRLKSDMEGGAPSLAQILLRKGTDENIAAANAIAASGGPGNAAAAGRQAALSSAKANQDLVTQSAALRAQEYTQARQEATGLANQLRVNDLMSTGMSYDNAIKQAQLEADQNKTQYQGNIQMAGIRSDQERGLLDLGMRGQALGSQEKMHLADLLMEKYGIDQKVAQQAADRASNEPGLLDYIMKGAAAGGAVGGPWGALAGAAGGAAYGAYNRR